MLIQDITAWADKTDFIVFKNAIQNGGSVRAIVAKSAANVYTRKKIDKLTEHAKGIGAKGLAYIRWADEAPTCSFNKFLKDGELDELIGTLGVEKGDCVFIVSDKTSDALSVLGALRLIVAKELDIIPQGKWNFLWITEMPFLNTMKKQANGLQCTILSQCLWKNALITLIQIKTRLGLKHLILY